jgi:hypothetical protein
MHPAFIHAVEKLKAHKEAPLIARVNDLDHFTVWAESLVERLVAEALEFDDEEDCAFFNSLYGEDHVACVKPRMSKKGRILVCEACKQAWTALQKVKP